MTHHSSCRQPHRPSEPALGIAEIGRRLRENAPPPCAPGQRKSAAVAMILREGSGGPEVLFIERAHHDGDPWSGDLGFPGGKLEPGDAGPRQAAERETCEEIGLDLGRAEYLGHLCDITGDHLPIFISCFVFLLPVPAQLILSNEVNGVFWVPLGQIFDPARHASSTVSYRDRPLVRPAIDLLGPGRTVLWGITYRLIGRFAQLLGTADHLHHPAER